MKKERKFIVIIILVSLFLGIGFAVVNNTTLGVTGVASAADNGKVKITALTLYQNSRLIQNQSSASFTDDSLTFDLKFNVSNSDLQNNVEFYATYKVTLTNDSISDYAFASSVFTPNVATTSNENMTFAYELIGINLGEIIPAKSSKDFYVKINIYPEQQGTYVVGGSSDVNTEQENNGTLIGTITGSTSGNLRSPNEIAHFTISVANTFQTAKTFSLNISNNNFVLTDSNGNTLGSFIVPAEDTQTFDFYIKAAQDATFAVDTVRVNVNLVPADDDPSSIGVVTILVDQDVSLSDDVNPTISGVSGAFQPTVGSVLVTWDGDDNIGIDYYEVEVYKNGANNNPINTLTTEADEEEMMITGLDDGTYYFKVTAYDYSQNSASAQSSENTYTWHFTVTWSLTNATTTGSNNDVVEYGANYTATLSGANNQDTPASVTIEMVGNDSPVYSYSANSGALTVSNVTGNLTITASGRDQSCLMEGTKILLANGTYKNVEDIDYTDLLAVWNHDTGTITYEYPLLIKNAKLVSSYFRISFSDNTYIEIFDDHGFFNTDINMYVAFKDTENFHVGSHIAKVSADGSYSSVEVTNIEEIIEDKKYYFIASARYFNIIANDLITSYQETVISNFYQFVDNAKWSSIKDYILLDPNNVYSYEMFSDVLPYYMYKGFRAGEAGFLINNNILTLNQFKHFIKVELMGEGIVKDPITISGEHYWMVTTSLDNTNGDNNDSYLLKEGSTYTLPVVDGITKYYSTSENKYYNPGDIINIYYSMHFIAIN